PTSATIKGGNAAGGFAWVGSTQTINGPFNGSNEVNGNSRYADVNTATAAVGDPNGSFISFALPVELVDFTINNTGNYHVANWSAVGTPENSTFIVSISNDGYQFTTFSLVAVTGEG